MRADPSAAIGRLEDAWSRGTAAAVLGLGIAFDVAFNGQRPGLSIPLFVLLLALAIRGVGDRSRQRDAMLGAALLFSMFPAIRASGALVALDLVVVTLLLVLAVAPEAGPLGIASTRPLVTAVVGVLRRGRRAAGLVARPLGGVAARLDGSRLRRAARAAAVVAPVILTFAALLAAADRVFADLVTPRLPDWKIGPAFRHVGLAAAGSLLVGTLWAAAREPRTGPAQRPRPEPRMRFAEWTAVLGGMTALFALFVGVQFAFLFGGHQRVEVTPGLTYAEYARSGFGQLVAVATLTLMVVVFVWDRGQRDGDRAKRWFGGLVLTIVGLTLVILASALLRLALYEAAFGFTVRRLFGYAAIAWIGVVLAVVAGAVVLEQRQRLIAAAGGAALVALLVVNVLGPDRFVANRNVARFRETGKIDVAYLGAGLSVDAVPVAVATIPALPRSDGDRLYRSLCAHASELGPEPSWRSWNLGRAAARRALERMASNGRECPGPGNGPPAEDAANG